MLESSVPLQVELFADAIPAYPQALALLERGLASSLAPANRRSWNWLDSAVQLDRTPSRGLLELLVDPQTCGPLLLACPEGTAATLVSEGPWRQIGIATVGHP